LLVLFSVLLFTTTMLTTHQVAYLQDLKYSPMVSATALGLMLGMSILGRILSGILGMRFKGRRHIQKKRIAVKAKAKRLNSN
jgi:F420-0:gamma-glutamyl ligase-like protein